MASEFLPPPKDQLLAFGRGELDLHQIEEIQIQLRDNPAWCTFLEEVPDDEWLKWVKTLIDDSYQEFQPLELTSEETAIISKIQSLDVATVFTSKDLKTPLPRNSAIPQDLLEHNRYQVLECIGQGGMGRVFRAEHLLMHRQVALKVINQELTRHPEILQRFQREVQAAASLSHKNIVQAYDAEMAGQTHFLAMEYVEGTDLSEHVKTQGPLEVETACHYIQQAAEGLEHAHQQGMVHRDIKPHNLMLTENSTSSEASTSSPGTVKILDFGLASLTEKITPVQSIHSQDEALTSVGTIMGTPDYLSPEQSEDAHSVDIRSDLYSLGATFHFLLTGKPPFPEGTIDEKLKAHLKTEPERVDTLRPDVPPEIADIIAKLLKKGPQDRFQTPTDLIEALLPFTDPDALKDAQATRQWQEEKKSYESKVKWTTITALLTVLVLFVSGAIYYIKTDKGTLIINAQDEAISVSILQKGEEVQVIDTLTGSRIVSLPSGTYDVKLKGEQNKFTLDKEKVTLTRDGKVIVTLSKIIKSLPPLPENAIVNSIGIRLVPLPKGQFKMGSTSKEKQRLGNEHQHPVVLDQEIYMGMFEVTQRQYHLIMGNNPSEFAPSSRSAANQKLIEGLDTALFPVENITYEDAIEFCKKLTQREAERNAGIKYRLPTEAEWEYACRAGTQTVFHFGMSINGERANVSGQHPYGTSELGPDLKRPARVGTYSPNAFNLYDMHGNVREWCSDWFSPDYYRISKTLNPKGPSLPYKGAHYNDTRVVRGGGFNSSGNSARSAARSYRRPTERNSALGFRVVCEIDRHRMDRIPPLVVLSEIEEAGGEYKINRGNQLIQASFMNNSFDDDVLKSIENEKSLRDLYLPNTNITDKGVEKYFNGLDNLVNLYLPNTSISDTAIKKIATIPSLRVLYLNNTKVTNEGLKELSKLTKLSTLSLNGTKITNEGLPYLQSLSHLYNLNLNSTEVNDEGLKHLNSLPNLSSLTLQGTQVSDNGIPILKTFSKLVMLDLRETKISSEGVEELKAHFTEATIRH